MNNKMEQDLPLSPITALANNKNIFDTDSKKGETEETIKFKNLKPEKENLQKIIFHKTPKTPKSNYDKNKKIVIETKIEKTTKTTQTIIYAGDDFKTLVDKLIKNPYGSNANLFK